MRALAAMLALPAAAASAQIVFVSPATPDADELATEMRLLAADPDDLNAMIRAGELTLKLDDTTAAAGFFARAERIDPNNPRIKAGKGSLLVQSGRPGEALRRFAEAEMLRGDVRRFAADRGLAYDLIGEQERAQRDYRLALRDGAPNDAGVDETTRRYALSLGISGRRDEALALIDALLRRSDRGAWRTRAFILAMTGDTGGAERIATSMMPGTMAQGLLPFFARLPRLSPVDKAFAVHFGEVRGTPQRFADARLAPPLPVLQPEPGRQPPIALAAAVLPSAREQRRRQREERRTRGRDRIDVAATPPPQPLPMPPAYRAPTEVALDQPAPPVFSQPAKPGYGQPATPGYGQPATPGYGQPAVPVYGRPSAPTYVRTTPPADAQPLPSVALAANRATMPPAPLASNAVSRTPPPETDTRVTTSESPRAPAAAPSRPRLTTLEEGEAAPAPVLATPVATRSRAEPPPVRVAAPPPATRTVASPTIAAPAAAVAPSGADRPTTIPAGTPPVAAAAPAIAPAAATLPPAPGPARGEDTILAKIIANITVPGSELDVAPVEPAPASPAAASPAPTAAPAEPAATPAEPPAVPAGPDVQAALIAEQKAADRIANDRKVVERQQAEQKAADKKAADARKLADAKKAEDKKKDDPKLLEPSRIWVQVAGGANEGTLPKEWARVRDKAPAAFKGRTGWTTPLRATNRVLAGPFKTDAEARTFVNALAKEGVSAFAFTSDAGQKVTRLAGK